MPLTNASKGDLSRVFNQLFAERLRVCFVYACGYFLGRGWRPPANAVDLPSMFHAIGDYIPKYNVTKPSDGHVEIVSKERISNFTTPSIQNNVQNPTTTAPSTSGAAYVTGDPDEIWNRLSNRATAGFEKTVSALNISSDILANTERILHEATTVVSPTTTLLDYETPVTLNSSLNLTVSSPELANPALGLLLSSFVVVVIVGNILVMVAVAKEHYLRSVTNYLIVSLAVADLLVGSIVMPFSIILEVMNDYWVFGVDWCDLWHSFDVLASTASILNLCVIALDRYWAITDPIAYPTKMSTKRVWILIIFVWVCSSCISFPAILWWRAVLPEQRATDRCEFTDDSSYLLISSTVSFYAPLCVMGFVYYRIYSAATQRTKIINSGGKIVTTEGHRGEVMTLRMHRGKKDSTATTTQRNGHEHLTYQRAPFTDTETDSGSHFTRSDSEEDRRPARFIKKKIQKFAISRKISKLAREQKAAKTLGIVMGVFILCWVPFFVANFLFAICHTSCISQPELFFPIFTWLGYLNSGMNPIIYALSMRDFRRAFKRILCMYCPKPSLPTPTKKKAAPVRSMSTSSFSTGYTPPRPYEAVKL